MFLSSTGDPCRVGVAMTDIATGLYVHGAIMGALFHRERTGEFFAFLTRQSFMLEVRLIFFKEFKETIFKMILVLKASF